MKYDLSKEIDAQNFQAVVKQHLEEGSKIEIKKIRQKRTLKQNNYLYVCLALLGNFTGYYLQEIKEIIYQEVDFMNEVKINLKGHPQAFIKSSSGLDTYEMTLLIDYIRQRAVDIGFYIPTPEEYLQQQYYYDNLIEYAV